MPPAETARDTRPSGRDAVYANLPPVDEAVLAERLAFLEESQAWDAARLRAYQLSELRRVLTAARDHVPFYRRRFAELGFEPERVTALDDLRQLPLLTKEEVKSEQDAFIDETHDPTTLGYLTSGGSTGDPLKVVMTSRFRSLNHANTHYYMRVAGYRIGRHRSVRLHGNPLSQALAAQGQYWQQDGRRLTMSIHHLTMETCAAYVAAIDRHVPDYIHAYPSALTVLCRCMEALDLQLTRRPESLFLDSETLHPWQRELFARVLGGRVFAVYGHTEGCSVAITFPDSPLLQVLPQVGVTELLRPDGTPCSEDGEVGEIVATGFNNDAFPLIRYRTFDKARLALPPAGHRPAYFPLFHEVLGRTQDFVVDRAGNRVAITPLLFDYNVDWSEVDRFQIRQERPGALELRIVRLPTATGGEAALAARVGAALQDALGERFTLTAVAVPEIRPTARGKFRYIDQRLPAT